MSMTYRYTIPLAPVTKKNSQRIFYAGGRVRIAPSAAYKAFERQAISFLRPLPKAPIDTPCAVAARYYMPTRRRVDLTNLMEATHDVLVTAGVLADDNSRIIVSVDGSRVLYDKEHPRTEIEIEILECVEGI